MKLIKIMMVVATLFSAGHTLSAPWSQDTFNVINRSCVSANGKKAKIIITQNVPCEACAYMDQLGNPLVTIDTQFWGQLSDASKAFVLGHECGHQKLGHTLDSKGSEPKGEFEADCWSVQLLFKNKLLTTKAELLDVEKDFYNFYGNLPFHRSDSHPGTIERFDAIVSCFEKISGNKVTRAARGYIKH